MKKLFVVIAALLMTLSMTGVSSAAPKSYSLSVTTPAPYVVGQSITFDFVAPKPLKNPVLVLDCFVNQVLSYEQRDLPSATFTIGGSAPETCVANVYDLVWSPKYQTYEYMVKAVTQFNVN